MTDLYALRDMIAAATGPSRELDEAVALTLADDHQHTPLAGCPNNEGPMMYLWPDIGWESALRVTSSIDAALALVERLLPGRQWSILFLNEGVYDACLSGPGIDWRIEFVAPSAPLAILHALVAALIVKEEADHG